MCLNLHPDFIITDCVFHYCFGIIGPGDMHLKNYNIQIYTILFNQQKSMKINTYVFLFRPQKLSLHLFTILKGKFCGKKNQWNYYWVILLRQFLIHDIFFSDLKYCYRKLLLHTKQIFFFFLLKERNYHSCLVILDVFPLCAWGSFLHMCRSCLSLVVIINKGFQI